MTFWPLHIIIIIGNDIAVNNTAFVLFEIFLRYLYNKNFYQGGGPCLGGKRDGGLVIWHLTRN